MPTTQTITIGAGRDYATIPAFATWLASQNLVTDDKFIDLIVYDDLVMTNSAVTLAPSNSDLTRYVRARPDPGNSFQELNPSGIVDWPATGRLLTFNSSTFLALRVSHGIVFEDFRIQVNTTAALTGNVAAFQLSNQGGGESPGGYLLGLRRCVLKGDNQYAATLHFGSGSNGNDAFADDCLIIGEGASAAFAACSMRHIAKLRRSTVVRRGSSFTALRVWPESTTLTPVAADVAVVGGDIELDYTTAAAGSASNTLTGNNWTDASVSVINPSVRTEYGAGKFNEGTGLVEDVADDLTPAAASDLIGAASSAADSTEDISYGNRGPAPDVGAIQRTPYAPLPAGEITTVTVSGQDVTIAGTFTGTVDSGTAVLIAAATPNGAVSEGPDAVTIGSGTFTITFTAVTPGSYDPPEVTLTNAGGSTPLEALAGVEILGIDGEPQVPDLEGGAGAAGDIAYRVNLINNGIVADFGILGLHQSGTFIPLL